jgi:hypothetical protein
MASSTEHVPTIRGFLDAWVLGPGGWNDVHDHRNGENVVCTTGFTQFTQALVWSGIEDQATNLGVTSPTYLAPIYGAVGSSSTTATKADTQLGAELGRVTVGAGGSTPASSTVAALATWLFYFPNPATTWSVNEAGVFAQASTAANSGSILNHWVFTSTIPVPTADTLVLQVAFSFGP